MKKTLFPFFTAILLSCAITNGYSQTPNNASKGRYSNKEYTSSAKEANTPKDSASAFFFTKISIKTVRNFTRNYKNVSDAKWFKLNNGVSVVYFTQDGIRTRVFYNKRGNSEGVIRDYSEDKLPYEIRHLVKSTYYDFNIYVISEVTVDRKTAYIVKIQDETSLKTIMVVNDEMVVMEEYIKSK